MDVHGGTGRSVSTPPPVAERKGKAATVDHESVCPSGPQVFEREVAVATEAVTKAAAIARSRFQTFIQRTPKGDTGDVVTDVDIECEEAIVRLLRAEFPQHAIIVEESAGHPGESRWSWVVDPLDGTNNYIHAFPVYGASVALCEEGDPVLACIAEAHGGSLIVAIRGSGTTVDGLPLQLVETHRSSVGAALWLGYSTSRRDDFVQALAVALSRTTRRTFDNWAPTVDVALYLRGGIDVIVGHRCSGTELPAALLALREAGARIVDLDGSAVDLKHVPMTFVAGRFETVDRVLQELRSGFVGRG